MHGMHEKFTMMASALFIYLIFACSSLIEGFTAPKPSYSLQGGPLSPYSSTHNQRPQSRATQTVFTKENIWDAHFAALRRYKNEHGNCLVPKSYSEDPKLANWVHRQRANANAGRVTDDRLRHLHSIGFFWDEQFDSLQNYKNKHGHCLVPLRYSDDPQLAQWVMKQRRDAKGGKLTDDQRKHLFSIGFDFAEQYPSWDEQFAALIRYKNKHGDCLVPISYSEDPKLGSWVNKQRKYAKSGKLTDDRRECLESIGFVFDAQDYIWDEQFAALQHYKNKHGNCLVPQTYSDDPKLGRWVKNQRTNAKAGRVADDRMKRLESIEFAFNARDYIWDEQFAALQNYKSVNGDCLVPQKYSDDPKLACWVTEQRADANSGKLAENRMNRLRSIGFAFDAQDYMWNEQFAALQRYKNVHGDCLVPITYRDDPQLAHWVKNQRERVAKAGRVTDDRMKRLESIGFVFDAQDYIWDEQFAALQRYKNMHGNCFVPISHGDDPKLGHWVKKQRKNAKSGKLTDDRMKRLLSIGFVFDVQDCIWDEQFAALQRYKDEHGDCLVPISHSDDPKLGRWVYRQRANAKAGKVTDDRMHRLESIGFELGCE